MLVSELIKKLQELQLEFGDLEVKVDNHLCDEQHGIDYLYLCSNTIETEYWFSISH